MKKKNGKQGSITIFLTILLIPMIYLSGLFVDLARFQLVKASASSASDLALRAYLADYDSALKETYGLFAVTQKGDGDDYAAYFKENMGMNFESDITNFLKVYEKDENKTVVSTVKESSLAEADVLKYQIVEYMKYRAPINAGLSLFDKLTAIKKVQNQTKVLKLKTEVDEQTVTFMEACEELYDNINIYKTLLSESGVDSWKEKFDQIKGWYSRTFDMQVEMKEAKEAYNKNYKKLNIKSSPIVESFEIFNDFENSDYESLIEDVESYDDVKDILETELENVKKNLPSVSNDSAAYDYVRWSPSESDFQNMSAILNNAKDTNLVSFMSDIQTICALYEYIKDEYPDKKEETKNLMQKELIKDERVLKVLSSGSRIEALIKNNEENIKAMYTNSSSWLDNKIKAIDALNKSIDNVMTSCDKVITESKKLKDKNVEFSGSVDKYVEKNKKEDEFSANMGQIAKSNKNDFDEKVVQELQANFSIHRASSDAIRTALGGNTYAGKDIASMELDIIALFKSLSNPSKADVVKFETYPDAVPGNPEGKFWEYLNQTFKNKENDSDAEEKKDKVVDAANQTNKSIINDASSSENPFSGKGDLPSGNNKFTDAPDNAFEGIGEALSSFAGDALSIFSELEDIAEDPVGGLTEMRDGLFVTNYVMNNFSYYTREKETAIFNEGKADEDKKQVTTFSGVKLNAATNPMYGGEVEYMIYGANNVNDNVNAMKRKIYTIRFAINVSYALCSSDINNVTNSIAAGVAIFGIPPKIIAVLLDICIATAETSVDMLRIETGEKVELFKSKDTFLCNPSGGNIDELLSTLNKIGKDSAKDFISDKSLDISNGLKGAVNDVIDNVTDSATITVDKYISDVTYSMNTTLNSKVDSIFESIRNTASNTLSNSLLNGYSKEDVKKALKTALSDLDISAQISSIEGIGEMSGDLESLTSATIEAIENEINSAIDSSPDDDYVNTVIIKGNEIVTKKLNASTRNIQEKINIYVKGKTDALSDTLKTKFGNVIDTNVDGMRDAVLSYTNELLDNLFPSQKGNSGLDTKNESLKSSLKMGYSDYIEMFYYLTLNREEKVSLLRMADIIQLNIQNGSNKDSDMKRFNPISGFKMNKAYTYVELKSNLSMKTLFIGSDYVQDLFKKNKDEFSYKFHSALGYS